MQPLTSRAKSATRGRTALSLITAKKTMRQRSFILVTICSVLLGCGTGSHTHSTPDKPRPPDGEACEDQTFLGNAKRLRASGGFRQNVWLSFNRGSIGAICMDLDRQLYLVIDTEFPLRSEECLSQRFRSLRVTPTTLRKRMNSDAFILDRDGIDWISRIPLEAEESFPTELFRELCGVNLKSSDMRFAWD